MVLRSLLLFVLGIVVASCAEIPKKTRVEHELSSAKGTIDRDAIRKVIISNLSVMKSCYEDQLKVNPDLYGKLVLAWEIGAEGKVLSAKAKSSELEGKEGQLVATCIVEKLKTWTFPEPPENQVVEVERYPFFFSN